MTVSALLFVLVTISAFLTSDCAVVGGFAFFGIRQLSRLPPGFLKILAALDPLLLYHIFDSNYNYTYGAHATFKHIFALVGQRLFCNLVQFRENIDMYSTVHIPGRCDSVQTDSTTMDLQTTFIQ
jgi:hypothetical protein